MDLKNRLSRWGIGPQIAIGAITYAVVVGAATHRWPNVCQIRILPGAVLVAVGILLLAIGVPMLAISVRSLMRAYKEDQFATGGLLALVRHPIYSAWIVFILPGLALLSRSWPVLLTPVVAYSVFKLTIHREDEYLLQRFGVAYLDYRARVNELIPVPKFWRRSAKAVPNAK
jgi:protein-S-isoprenylcysteine O-methyltransferase Ste14